jgi:hypothetical protein
MHGKTLTIGVVLLSALAPACTSDSHEEDPLLTQDAAPRRPKAADSGESTVLYPTDEAGSPFDAVDAATDAAPDAGSKPAPLGPVAPACKLDTRAVYIQDGRKLESITAYGRYWSRELKNGGSFEGVGFPHAVLAEPKFANGPCAGKPGCTLDTRVIWFNGAAKTESTTSYGTSWSWTFDAQGGPVPAPGSPQPLTATTAFRDGPCALAGGAACAFDTRTLEMTAAGRIESITAYGRWFEYIVASDLTRTSRVTGLVLSNIPRLAAGPCKDQPASACSLDTRTIYTDLDGSRTEEITARGRLWVYRLAANDSVLATVTDGSPLVGIARLTAPCAH